MRISDWSSDVCSSDLVRIFGQHLVQSWTRGRSAIEGAGFVPLRVGSVHQNIPEGLCLEADLRRPMRVAPMLIAGEMERAGRGPEGLGVEPAFLARGAERAGERRVGEEWVSTCRTWGGSSDYKKKKTKK